MLCGIAMSNNTHTSELRPSWDRGASNKSWSFIEGIVTDIIATDLRTNGLGSEAIVLNSSLTCFGVETTFRPKRERAGIRRGSWTHQFSQLA